jgi:hypothetical protein
MRVGAVGGGVHAVNAILPNLPVAGLQLVATPPSTTPRLSAALAQSVRLTISRRCSRSELDGVVVVVQPGSVFAISACTRGVPVFTDSGR